MFVKFYNFTCQFSVCLSLILNYYKTRYYIYYLLYNKIVFVDILIKINLINF